MLRGWSEAELRDRLADLADRERNFDERDLARMAAAGGWKEYGSVATIAREPPGEPEPDGAFERGRDAIRNYRFSDPAIVECHFDPGVPLEGRRMLLELKVLGLHYLAGVAVGAVHDDTRPAQSVWGYRYDTLRGHVEAGSEWFLLAKDHASGEVRFRIHARWRAGDFPNWWSRLGFSILAERYQRRWHRRAHARMHGLVRAPVRGRQEALAHEGPRVTFHYGELEKSTEWEWRIRE